MTEMFGEVYAPLYDGFYDEKDYEGETEQLTSIFRSYARHSVKTVLDLGCGTANHALRLAARGYEVTGIDRSKEMLMIAEKKTSTRNSHVSLKHGDIRNCQLGVTFDAAVMMFAVLSYQLEDGDVLGALKTARSHLSVGGLLIFDVWYGPAVLAQGTQQRVRTARYEGETWARTSSGQLETGRNLCHVEFQLKQLLGDVLLSETIESHTVRYFFANEVNRFLSEAGFRLLRLGAFPIFDQPPSDATWNAMVVSAAV